jgi:hypothetical protein
MKYLVLLFLMTLGALAQEPNPTYFIGAGAAYSKYAQPTPMSSGWATVAVQTSASSGIYSITTIDMTSTTSSLRTGVAKLLMKSGNFTLMAHADGGITTGSALAGSAVTVGSFSGGGLLIYDMGGLVKAWKGQGINAVAVVRVLAITAASVQPVFEFGFGKTF